MKVNKILSVGFVISFLALGVNPLTTRNTQNIRSEIIEYAPAIISHDDVQLNFHKDAIGDAIEIRFDVGREIVDITNEPSTEWTQAAVSENSLMIEYTYFSTRYHGMGCKFAYEKYIKQEIREDNSFKNWGLIGEGLCGPSSSHYYFSKIEYQYIGFEGSEIIYEFRTNVFNSFYHSKDSCLNEALTYQVWLKNWVVYDALSIIVV